MAAEQRILKGVFMSIRVLFICHGNICRSPMAEFILKDIVTKRGIADQFEIASAATSTEEIWNGVGNPVYPPAREELARQAFKEGYNCSQAMVAAFSELMGMDKKTALRLASSFGGGMGRMREVCGAVTGMFMVVGILYGYDDAKDYEGKKDTYALVQELANQFKAETGSIICRELLGLDGKDNSPVPSKRTEEYYKKRTCEDKVGLAAKILDEYIQSHCPNGTCNF